MFSFSLPKAKYSWFCKGVKFLVPWSSSLSFVKLFLLLWILLKVWTELDTRLKVSQVEFHPVWKIYFYWCSLKLHLPFFNHVTLLFLYMHYLFIGSMSHLLFTCSRQSTQQSLFLFPPTATLWGTLSWVCVTRPVTQYASVSGSRFEWTCSNFNCYIILIHFIVSYYFKIFSHKECQVKYLLWYTHVLFLFPKYITLHFSELNFIL